MGAMRIAVYELAKELGVSSQTLMPLFAQMGVDVKNHMSRVSQDDAARVRHRLEKERQAAEPVQERLSTTVIRRRAKDVPAVAPVVETRTPFLRTAVESQRVAPLEHEPLDLEHINSQEGVSHEDVTTAPQDLQHEAGADDVADKTPVVAEVFSVAEPSQLPEPQAAAPAVEMTTAPRSSSGLGPTGRVIDLGALRLAPRGGPDRTATPAAGRGPRQEVQVERARPGERLPRGAVFQKKHHGHGAERKGQSTQLTTAAEHKRVVKMGDAVVLKDFANQLGVKATEVLKKVWALGARSIMINSSIDFDTAQLVAEEFGWKVESNVFQEALVLNETSDAAEDLELRAPVITIMGHVDHGKTSLLDAIRNANVAQGEAGGITQHIGAYKVRSAAGDVVFLDTPGHEAFTEMRARGAQATDIVVLVVAADDGVMPQTIEALNHAKDAKVPIVVAVNKIDKPGAQSDRIRQQLAGHDLVPEEWGGSTMYVDVSAKTRVGVDKLLEILALQAEVMELKANPNKAAKGIVVEARMDARRGAVSTVLVQEGTLRQGDIVVVGEEMGKIRAMVDDKGKTLSVAGPSTPVEILGISGVPRAGDLLNGVSDERAAKELVEHRRQRRLEKERAKGTPSNLERMLDAMRSGIKDLKIILKADVQGSLEALGHALVKLSTAQIKVVLVQSGVGGITETDVNLAKAGGAVIMGFHVRPAPKAAQLADQEGVDIRLYDVIYDALDDVKKMGSGLLAPVQRERVLGRAEIRQVFQLSKVGVIVGCWVLDGLIRRNAQVRLVRDSVKVYQGKLASLKRFKDDAREVQQGYECGLSIEGYNDIKVGDVVECFEVEQVAASMDNPSATNA